MKVQRKHRTRRSAPTAKVRRSRRRRRPMEQINKLRIWTVILAVLAAAAAAGLGFYFWHSFAEPFREAEERNAKTENVSGFENHSDYPVYDDAFTLVLANNSHPLPESFAVQAAEFEGVQVDERIVVYLKALLRAAEKDGVDLKLVSGYVSREEQEASYQAALQKGLDSGLPRVKAEDNARRSVGAGGCSDFQTGLAVRFSTGEKGDFSKTEAFRWLRANCIQYGFVLRCPENKTDHTQRPYDPSHYRFVGIKHATRMQELSLCLEEYADYRKMQGDL